MAQNVKWSNQGRSTGRPWHWATVYKDNVRHDFHIIAPGMGSDQWMMSLYTGPVHGRGRAEKIWYAPTRAELKKIVREEY